jgi:hypothetical protein
VRRNLGYLARNTAGLLYRGARFLLGRETRLRVAEPVFWNVQALGALWGHCRGKRRVAAARHNGDRAALEHATAPSSLEVRE